MGHPVVLFIISMIETRSDKTQVIASFNCMEMSDDQLCLGELINESPFTRRLGSANVRASLTLQPLTNQFHHVSPYVMSLLRL